MQFERREENAARCRNDQSTSPEEAARATRMTGLLLAATRGDAAAADELPALLYEELRSLARRKLAALPPGQTLQATALVHEAWLRMGGGSGVERARMGRARALLRRRRAGDAQRARRPRAAQVGARHRAPRRFRCADDTPVFACQVPFDDVLAVDEALAALERLDAGKARLVMLRFFTGLSMPEVAELIGVSLSTAEREWRFARSWLQARILPRERS